MSKPFITYTAQVEKLKNEKNLVITDDDFAVESLQNISYYALIGGYKHPFIDIHTRKYINEACFEDIVALYEFDEELRGIFFKYLCRVERKMRSSISYHFCKKHGERQEEYLNSNNYGNIPKNIDIPDTLLHKKLGISKNGSKYVYGKNDLFSVVITFRYLLPKTDFLLFKKQLLHIFDRYEKRNSNLKLNDLFEYMGFPINWKEITKFRKI